MTPLATPKKLRVLLAESGPADVERVFRELFPQAELTVVSTFATLLPTAYLVNPEFILLDLSLAHPDPLGAVRLAHRAFPNVPLIVFAYPADKDYAVQALGCGALDYLLKGYMDARVIDRVVRAALERNTLEGLADLLRDPLTGLFIREGFLALGAHAMESAKRGGGTLVLVCLLFENLAAVRSEFGPHVSDQSVRDLASILAGCFRRTDLIVRLGETQFAALAIDAAEPSAALILQRIATRIAIRNQDTGPARHLNLRMSVAFWGANNNKSFPEFLDAVEADLSGSQPSQTLNQTLDHASDQAPNRTPNHSPGQAPGQVPNQMLNQHVEVGPVNSEVK